MGEAILRVWLPKNVIQGSLFSKVPGFCYCFRVSKYWFPRVNIFKLYCIPKMTSTRRKQLTEHGVDVNNN